MAEPDARLDGWTVGAIAVIAYCAATFIHEAGGHGGACLALGCKPQVLDAFYFNFDESSVGAGARRAIVVAGSVANWLVGGLLLALSPRLPTARARYFAWLLGVLNFITPSGYLLYSGVANVGDWAVALDGLPWRGLWRALEIATGGALYFVAAPRLTWPGIAPFIGAGPDRVRRARRLTLLPYFVGAVVYVAAGARNPLGLRVMLISAVAAGFGGASLLAWFFAPHAAELPAGAPATLTVTRSYAWMLLAAVVFVVFVGLLGPGVTL
jgi:hypothetical protein